MKAYDDISDDEIRFIGHDSEQAPVTPTKVPPKRILFVLVGVVAALVLVFGILFLNRNTDVQDESMAIDIEVNAAEPASEIRVENVTVDGAALQLVYVDGLAPSLHIGPVDTTDKSIRVVLQAADYRADNGEIVGDFVLAGSQLSRGCSKRGYCEITDNQLTIGCSDESGCAQCAIDQKGYFFRQYLLVNNGRPMDLKPKGTHLRRALCMNEQGNLFLVFSQKELTFDAFAKVLSDIPVSHAIYLTGGSAYGYMRTLDGEIIHFGYPVQILDKPNVNYLVFK